VDRGDDSLPRLSSGLLSPNFGIDFGKIIAAQVDTSWLTKIAVDMSNLGKAMVASIVVPDFSKLDLRQSVKDGVRTMAARGWTVQMSLTLGDLEELANQTPEETDEFFVAFYTSDNFAALREVREELTRRPGLAQWKGLLEECFDSFESGRHRITVPALLSIIEGVIASAGQALTSQRVRLVEICAEQARKSGENVMTSEMWNSMALFLEKLFQYAPFDGGRPTLINRHWILHGRDSGSWTVADGLRLFNALQTVDSLLE
jgi:hypothetical protein